MLAVTLSTILAACMAVRAAPTLVRRAPIISNCNHDFAYSWDDGPYTWHEEINGVFQNVGGKTTFFTNGDNWTCIYSDANIAALRQSYEEGHEIGHHTWSHADLQTLTYAQIDDEINRLNDAFIRILGVRPKVLRPPYGSINQDIADYLYEKWGLTVVLWSADSQDSDDIALHHTVQWSTDFYHAQADNYNGAAMPLSHETYSWSVGALTGGTAAYIRSKNINLVTIAQCIDVEPYETVTGVYGVKDSSWTCDGPYVPMNPTTTTTTSSTAAPTCVSTYSSGAGDTCASIGAKYGLTAAQILAANTFLDCSNIWQYTPVCIPPGGSTGPTSTTSTTHTTSTTSSSTAAPTCVSTYSSGAGDTCDSIGAKFGLTGAQILAANTFLNCQDIWQYTPICIPPGGSGSGPTSTTTTTSSAPAPSCVSTYSSQQGDTCASIGTKYGLTADQILAANTFLSCSDIWAYTPICIPPGGAPATCTSTYYSVAGDTCDSIGAKYGVSGAQILTWNSFLTCSDIWAGTPVCV